MRAEIIAKLRTNQDLDYRDFHRKTCPGAGQIIGVRMPIQRKIAREIIRGDFCCFLNEAQGEFYEEIMLEGLVIAEAPMVVEERINRLRGFAPKIQNWAICDAVCASLKISADERGLYWQFIEELMQSKAEFERRLALVMALDHFLVSEYLERIFDKLEQAETEQYYVQMASAWLIAEAMPKARERTLEFLQQDNLSKFTHNKAIQKICESYRVTAQDKISVRKLRR